MARYRVRFIKSIPNSSGHLASCVQRAVEVEAPNSKAAIADAQQAFCALMGLSECRFYADAFEVDQLTESSRRSRSRSVR